MWKEAFLETVGVEAEGLVEGCQRHGKTASVRYLFGFYQPSNVKVGGIPLEIVR